MQHRIDWIDALKGFAILTVVIGHCITDSLSSRTFPEYAALLQMMYDAIYSFHMPLFFYDQRVCFLPDEKLSQVENQGAGFQYRICHMVCFDVVF